MIVIERLDIHEPPLRLRKELLYERRVGADTTKVPGDRHQCDEKPGIPDH